MLFANAPVSNNGFAFCPLGLFFDNLGVTLPLCMYFCAKGAVFLAKC